MADYNLNRTVFDKASYQSVIDTSLGKSNLTAPPPPLEDTITVEEFFNLYRSIFYNIPISGNNNSHEYIVKTSGEYIKDNGITEDTQVLLDEITSLRQQLLTLSEANLTLQLSSNMQ
jgi:hypothetical protein